MKKYLIVILCFISLSTLSQQEKRLALVIGNGNYDKGALKNPVNDALLIAKTLEKLDFDIILDTNIAYKRDFVETIKEFGNKRQNCDVALVYYAGHGIQVNNVLPVILKSKKSLFLTFIRCVLGDKSDDFEAFAFTEFEGNFNGFRE